MDFGFRDNGEPGTDDASSANITFVGVVYDHWIGRLHSVPGVDLSIARCARPI